MKALVGTFNQEKVLVGAFSVIVKTLLMVRLQLYPVFTWLNTASLPLGDSFSEGMLAPGVQHVLSVVPILRTSASHWVGKDLTKMSRDTL